MYDLGDVVPLTLTVPGGNADLVVLTITNPDGTTTVPSNVTNLYVGMYKCLFTTVQVGLHGVRWVATSATSGNTTAQTDVFTVNDPLALPLISLAEAKASITLTDTTTDEQIRQVLEEATELAERFCHRALRRKTVTNTFSGSYAQTYSILHTVPIISVTSVTENGVTLVQNSDYTVDTVDGIVWRGIYPGGAPWALGVNNVTITYVAGYANPPLAAVRGVKAIFQWIWQSTQQGPRAGFGQNGIEAGADAIPDWVYRPLRPLVAPGIG